MFELDPQLGKDCITLGSFPLSLLLLNRDASYPWFILVPQRPAIIESYQLSAADRRQLLDESCLLSEVLMEVFAGDKLNVAALGNVVTQLHVHHIVRYTTDKAWPRPVWGVAPAEAYSEQSLARLCGDLLPLLADAGFNAERLAGA